MTKNNTPELDENGNPIVPGGDATVTLSKEEHDEIVKGLAESRQAVTNLRGELIELRKKKDEVPGTPSEAEVLIDKKLAEQEAARIEEIKKAAAEQIVGNVPALAEEGNLKRFEDAIAKINFAGAKTERDFIGLYENALKIAGIDKPAVTPRNPYASTPRGGEAPKGNEPTNLSLKEQAFVKKHFGGDEKAYLTQMAKRPEYIGTLLEYFK